MPNLRQLEYLVALADTGHFRRAAEQAHTTQPTLSEQVKALEQRLGVEVIERTRSGALLTPIGIQIVEIARRMLSDANEIRSLAASGGRELAGVLRIGLPPTVGPYLLPRIIPTLHAKYPSLRLYVREELPNSLPQSLESGRHDLIISLLPVRGRELVSHALFREPLLLAVGNDHELSKMPRIRRSDLTGQDVLTLGPGHQLHDVVQSLCREFGARLRFDYEGTSLDTLREMVAMGLGVTFLPGLYVRSVASRDESVVTRELADRAVYRTIGVIWRGTSARQEQYLALVNLIRDVLVKEFQDLELMT